MATVEIRKCQLTEINVSTPDWGWARVLIEEDTGRVIVVSDYGEWSHCWWSIGNRTIFQFLNQLDSHYMGGKFLGAGLRVRSEPKTYEKIKKHIIDNRKDNELTKDEARNEWDIVETCFEYGNGFEEWCGETEFFRDYPWDMSVDRVVGCWESFWNHIWVPHVKPQLEKL